MDSKKSGGIKWPVCTLLFLIGVGALSYWTYTKFQEEQAIIASRQAAPAQSAPAAPQGMTTPPAGQAARSYRGELPGYLLYGFAALMIVLLGTILYLWWSLKDWEGGRKYGEDEDASSGRSP